MQMIPSVGVSMCVPLRRSFLAARFESLVSDLIYWRVCRPRHAFGAMLRPRHVFRSADHSAQCGFVCHFQVHLLGVSRRPGTFLRPFRTGPFGAVQPCVVRFLNCLGRPPCIPSSLTVPTTVPTSRHGPAHHPAVPFPNPSFSSKDVLLSLASMGLPPVLPRAMVAHW